MFEFGAWFCNVDQRQTGGQRLRPAAHPGQRRRGPADAIRHRCQLHRRGPDDFDYARHHLGDRSLSASCHGCVDASSDGNFTAPPAGGAVALRGKKRGRDFLIGHDLYLWSPKGFLTGSANTPGSVFVGTSFQRTDVSCEFRECNPAINGGQFHRGAYIIREWDLWYFIAPRMSIGGGACGMTLQI